MCCKKYAKQTGMTCLEKCLKQAENDCYCSLVALKRQLTFDGVKLPYYYSRSQCYENIKVGEKVQRTNC